MATMMTISMLYPFYVASHLCVNPFYPIRGVLHSAIEVDRSHVLGAGLLPGVAVAQPIISLLHL